jgi:hypothetical protein
MTKKTLCRRDVGKARGKSREMSKLMKIRVKFGRQKELLMIDCHGDSAVNLSILKDAIKAKFRLTRLFE